MSELVRSAVLLVSIKNVRIWELTAFAHINSHNDKFIHIHSRHVVSATFVFFIFRYQAISSIPAMYIFTTSICGSIDGKTDRTVIFIWNDYVNCRMCMQLLINMEIRLWVIYTPCKLYNAFAVGYGCWNINKPICSCGLAIYVLFYSSRSTFTLKLIILFRKWLYGVPVHI